eukprot:CAMPEP_0172474658 /NCGR_PEP_ID=MMETSP1065-20121228/69472_1 /TAXON_ID=265537 /ORGANISM="Amphiprora paludosa, Strain CCMP125" /LENGTH=381 /DNA_ID=CAMNT_0013232845 /DNA_START=34 /DNA_END=1179 /DNA_ORIENTATION=+
MPDNNPNNQRLLHQFVVELMWIASVHVSAKKAVSNRRKLIHYLCWSLDTHEPNSDVNHNLVYSVILLVDNTNSPTYLRSDLVANLLNTLNERNSANLYARRCEFVSILRGVQAPFALASVLPGQQESPSDGEDTIIQQFLEGDFDALRQIEPGELLNRLTANPATLHQLYTMPDNNPNNQRLLHQFVVELMWIASVHVSAKKAVSNRRKLIHYLCWSLDTHEPNSDVNYNLVYSVILLVDNTNSPTYLRSDLVANLLNTLNERNSANLYARRCEFVSILRGVQAPFALVSVLPGQQESLSDGEDTIIQQFLEGDFDALRQIEPGELLNRLTANPATLHQLYAMPDEPGIAQEPDGSSGAWAGNSNNFSQGRTAEPDREGLA